MTRSTDLLVLGSGAAGSAAAFAAKKQDPSLSVLIVSREAEPEYSAPALPDLLSGELTREKVLVRSLSDYENAGIGLLFRDVVRIDPDGRFAELANGDRIAYRELILASGSLPIQLRRMKGTDLPGNFVMKTMADVDAMASYPGKSAVVVGSGAIGIEGSMALKERGYEKVTMVEALEWLSPKSLDRETSDELKAVLERFGVEVLTGEAVQGVLGEEKVGGVVTEKRTIPCDLVLWGIGMRPETALAKDAGIAAGSLGGICVDDHMRTNVSHIYACGDCAESPDILSGMPALHLFWEPAQRGGAAAGVNAAGGDRAYLGSAAVFLTNKGGLTICAFGKTESELDRRCGLVLEERRGEIYRRLLLEDGRLKGVQMVGSLQDIDLFMGCIRRNALQKPDAWDMTVRIPDEALGSVRDAVFFLRRARRAAVK